MDFPKTFYHWISKRKIQMPFCCLWISSLDWIWNEWKSKPFYKIFDFRATKWEQQKVQPLNTTHYACLQPETLHRMNLTNHLLFIHCTYTSKFIRIEDMLSVQFSPFFNNHLFLRASFICEISRSTKLLQCIWMNC